MWNKIMALSSIISPDLVRKQICKAFCSSVTVTPVATGLAVSSVFEDNSGDRISFYITETPDGIKIEDDGSYLAHLVASGIAIDQGSRSQMLDAILDQAGAHWDRETFEIRSSVVEPSDVSKRAIDFLSSLIRIRDLELLTRENIRSTFREDAIAAISERFGAFATLEEDAPIYPDFSEFPADLIVRPKASAAGRPGAIYFANSNEKLNEALLLKMEALNRQDFGIIALIEEPDMGPISRRKFQRAQNRSLPMPIFRGDEDAAMKLIGRELGLAA